MLAGAAMALFAAAPLSGTTPNKPLKPAAEKPALVRPLDCTAHRFETTIELSGPDGKLHGKTVRMCGVKGETDAEWIATLNDAVEKTLNSAQMPRTAKEQIVAAVRAEIARLSNPPLNLPQGGDIGSLGRRSWTNPAPQPSSRDYSPLPELPTASTVPPPDLLRREEPTAKPAHLSLRCAIDGDSDHSESCLSIERDSLLILRADEDYPNGLAIEFLRRGDSRARLDLPAMNAGETRTMRLPAAVCAGVVRSTLTLDALQPGGSKGAARATIGEYDLRC